MQSEEEFVNPIDKTRVTETPGLLPYAHTVGSAIIRPIDQGRTKGVAMQAMYEQTGSQLSQIRKQVEQLLGQAQEIHERIRISESIYKAECRFKPGIGQRYYLYKKEEGGHLLSIIGPEEWGKGAPYAFEATVKLLSDHTWEVLEFKK